MMPFAKRPTTTRGNYFRRERDLQFDEMLRERKRAEEQAEKERLVREALQPSNFPTLTTPSSSSNTTTTLSCLAYKDKLEQPVVSVGPTNEEEDTLPRGWTLLQKDPVTGKVHRRSRPISTAPPTSLAPPTEHELVQRMFTSLARLHETRTREFIKQYGYEEWESTFKFPDWRERDAYLEHMDIDELEYDDRNREYYYSDDEPLAL